MHDSSKVRQLAKSDGAQLCCVSNIGLNGTGDIWCLVIVVLTFSSFKSGCWHLVRVIHGSCVFYCEI